MVTKRLGKLDWIKAAFRALTHEGLQAVKVEPVARALKVSKGSFYWHFTDLGELHAAMVAHWEQAATQDVITELEAAGGAALDKLIALVGHSTSDKDAPYGGPLAEVAIRAWAGHDAQVHQAQSRVDEARLSYLAQLFLEDGQTKAAARSWARLVLFAYLGSAHAANQDRSAALMDLIAAYRVARER